MTLLVLVLVLVPLFTFWSCGHALPIDTENEWNIQAQASLKASRNAFRNYNVAKNVILFIGDGMGVSTVTAARIYKGQKEGQDGEETVLNFEQFPDLALSKTYNTDRQVADSSATATAMLAGVKTRFGAIGVNHRVPQYDCDAMDGNTVDSILDWSYEKGKSTGIVTTTRLTHATPAAAYGHTPWRYWEVDHTIPTNCIGKVEDLSIQLLEHNRHIKVILGGGRSYFIPKTEPDPEYKGEFGVREDGRNLIQEWENYHKKNGSKAHYVWNATSFAKIDPEKTDFLLGVFEPNNMQFELDRSRDTAGEPSLADMTSKAIHMLDNNEDGYFLLVEAGRIDHAHHYGNAKRALEDTVALTYAVERALELTNEKDTLIVVTADHSHTLTIGTYAPKGNNILGFTDALSLKFAEIADEFPVTTLMYANGPGPTERSALKDVDPTHDDFKQPAQVPMKYETHGGEDVAIYARGPMSHLFHGVQEQNYIAHAMAFISCVGSNTEHCERMKRKEATSTTNKASRQSDQYIWFLIIGILVTFLS